MTNLATLSIKKTLSDAAILLTNTSSSARTDAEVLLLTVLGVSRTFLYSHPEALLTQSQQVTYQRMLEMRAHGTPIAYLTGTREFWSLPLHVSRDTLIPRPETELLVETALELLVHIPHARILDLGTGSGAIALALASERPDWQILACDKSHKAVHIARDNAQNLGIHNVRVVQSDWFSNIHEEPFHAILSNPPYIAEQDPHLREGDLRFEPREALVSGVDGLESLAYIIQQSYARLQSTGILLLEHGYDQGAAVVSLLNKTGYQRVRCLQDAQGHDRVSGGFRQ